MTDVNASQSGYDRRLILGVVELSLIIILVPIVVPPLLYIQLPSYTNFAGIATAGIIPTIISLFFPRETQLQFVALARSLLATRSAVIILNACLFALIVCIFLTRYTFEWAGSAPLPVLVNGSSYKLTKQSDDDGYATNSLLRIAFLPVDFRAGLFHSYDKPRVFNLSRNITIPTFVTLTDIPKYREADFYLLKILFQSTEATTDSLTRVTNILAVEAGTKSEKDAKQRLETILSILSNANTVTDSGALEDDARPQIDDLEKNSPKYQDKFLDPWVTLTDAMVAQAEEHYPKCISDITDDFIQSAQSIGLYETASAAQFLRGFCHLVNGQDIEKKNSDASDPRSEYQLDLSRSDFRASEELASKATTNTGFRDLAVASSRFFEGVSQFYEGNTGQSISDYNRTFYDGPSLMRARALSAAGFAYFTEGHIKEANGFFEEALRAAAGYPKAEINYGFSLMSTSDYPQAVVRFNAGLNGEDGNALLSNDQALAELGKIHLGEYQKSLDVEQAASQYGQLLHRINIVDDKAFLRFDLHYAYSAIELTKKIYLPPHSFGNEVLALAFLCHTHQILKPISNLPRDQVQDYLAVQDYLYKKTQELNKFLNTFWYAHPQDGWYASVAKC